MQIRKANRQKAKIRLNLAGPSGSGKSISGLRIAYGITGDWDKIGVIDTENNSADLYANHTLPDGFKIGEFLVLPLLAPYSPERYIEAIEAFEKAGVEVIILDSATHEWDGKGGALEINERLANSKFKGNTWAAWSETTPRHQNFISKIVNSPLHIITTTRSKTETIQTEDKKVKKIGLKEIQREGYEYELTLSFSLDRDGHYAVAAKDRTGLFIDTDPFIITEDTGRLISDWCENGEDISVQVNAAVEKVSQCNSLDELDLLKSTLPVIVVQTIQYLEASDKRTFELNADLIGDYNKKLEHIKTPDDLTKLLETVNGMPEHIRKPLRGSIAQKAKAMGWISNAETKRYELAPAQGNGQSDSPTLSNNAPAPNNSGSAATEAKPNNSVLLGIIGNATTLDHLESIGRNNDLTAPELKEAFEKKRIDLTPPAAASEDTAPKAGEASKEKRKASPRAPKAPAAEENTVPVAQKQELTWFRERLGKEVFLQGATPDEWSGRYVIEAEEYPEFMFNDLQNAGATFRDVLPTDEAVAETAAA